MYRKTTTRPVPDNAIRINEKKIKVTHKGRMIEREVNESGRMIIYSSRYYAKVRQPDGTSKEVALTTDRTTSLQLLANAQRQSERIAAGLDDAPCPDEDRPCLELLDSWLQSLDGKDRAPTYLATVRQRMTRLIQEAPFPTPRQLSHESAGRTLQSFLRGLRTGAPIALPVGESFSPMQVRTLLGITSSGLVKLASSRGIVGTGNGKARRFSRDEAQGLIGKKGLGCSPATANAYRNAFQGFSNWLKKQGIIKEVARLPDKENERRGQRKTRRAISWDECRKLAETTISNKKTRANMPSAARGLLYLVAFRTLLRARALRELTVADCHLAGPNPFLAVRAETDKTGRARAVPLPKDLADDVSRHIQKRKPTDRLWDIPASMAKAMRRDLLDAGIPFKAPEGECDFHALRHSGATHMARAGVSLDIVAKVGGWTSLTQFFSRYGHYSIEHLSEAAAKSW